MKSMTCMPNWVCKSYFLAASAHHVEEFDVALRGLHALENHFHSLNFIHVVHELAQDARFLQHLRLKQQLFPARTTAVQVDGREHALFVQTALQMNFAIACSFELFKDHFVHAATGIDQSGCNDGQATAFFYIASRAEETLGALQRIGIDTTR